MAAHAMADPPSAAAGARALRDRIEAVVNEEPYRPWCVHRLHEELEGPDPVEDRAFQLMVTQLAADQLADRGRLLRQEVSAVTIGVHCQDTLYWSPKAGYTSVEGFGTDYESPALLRRLGAHFQCHGL
jgi:hypothetical protein